MNATNKFDALQQAETTTEQDHLEPAELRFMTLDELSVVGGGGDAVNIG